MAMVAYPALRPSILGSTEGVLATYGATPGTVTFNKNGIWGPGDYAILVVNGINSAATPTAVTVGSTNIAMTLLGSGNGTLFYIAKNNTINTEIVNFSVTWGATYSGEVIYSMTVVTGATSYNTGSVTTGTVAANADMVFGTGLTGVTEPSLVLALFGTNHTATTTVMGTYSIKDSSPGSIGAYAASIPYPTSTRRLMNIVLGNDVLPVGGYSATTSVTLQDSTSTVTQAFAGLGISFIGVSVTLDDNTLQLGTGPLLNSPSNIFPLFDVNNIDGISDLDIGTESSSIDGANGSYVQGKYASGKTIVIDGTIYSTAPFNEQTIEDLKSPFAVYNRKVPLFWKPVGKNPRKLLSTPSNIRAPIDRGRATSIVPFQLQMLTQDAFPTNLLDSALSYTTSVSRLVVPYLGTAEAFPLIFFRIGTTNSAAGIYFVNLTYNAFKGSTDSVENTGIWIDTSAMTPGAYLLDIRNRSLYDIEAGTTTLIDISTNLKKRNWWTLVPKSNNTILTVLTGITPSGQTLDHAYITWQDAWL